MKRLTEIDVKRQISENKYRERSHVKMGTTYQTLAIPRRWPLML